MTKGDWTMTNAMTSGAKARAETMRRAQAEKDWHRQNFETFAKYRSETARRARADRAVHTHNQ